MVDPKELKWTDGHIASSNLLLKNETVLQKLHLERDEQIKGGEMEGAGFAEASRRCKAEWLVVRSVSDLGDSDKSDTFQDYASANAAAYVAVLIRNLDLDLIRGKGVADILLQSRKQKVENETTVILESFATIFQDQLGKSVNLEVYWKGFAKYDNKIGGHLKEEQSYS